MESTSLPVIFLEEGNTQKFDEKYILDYLDELKAKEKDKEKVLKSVIKALKEAGIRFLSIDHLREITLLHYSKK